MEQLSRSVLQLLFQSVPEGDVIGRWQDAQACSAAVECCPLLARKQLYFTHQQRDAHELLQLVNGEEPAGTHRGPRSKRHAIIANLLTTFIEIRLLCSAFHVPIEPVLLRDQKHNTFRSFTGDSGC